jgi:hypothetical protein
MIFSNQKMFVARKPLSKIEKRARWQGIYYDNPRRNGRTYTFKYYVYNACWLKVSIFKPYQKGGFFDIAFKRTLPVRLTELECACRRNNDRK